MVMSSVHEQVMSTVQELYGRANSGDLLYVFLVLVNAYVKPIPQVCVATFVHSKLLKNTCAFCESHLQVTVESMGALIHHQHVCHVARLQVANSIEGTSLGAVACMLRHCGQEVVSCVRDPSCSTALSCLDACSYNDQVFLFSATNDH